MSKECKDDTVTLLLCNASNRGRPLDNRAKAIRKCASNIMVRTADPALRASCKSIVKQTADLLVIEALDKAEKAFNFSPDTEI
jgi:hypothetical protein